MGDRPPVPGRARRARALQGAPLVEQPEAAATEAAGQILDKLAGTGLLTNCGIARRLMEPFVASKIQAAIGRCICPPSEGLGK